MDYRDVIDEYNFPNHEIDAMCFDMAQNAYMRKTNKSKYYFYPAEAMLVKFLRSYTAMTEKEIELSVKANRKAWIISTGKD